MPDSGAGAKFRGPLYAGLRDRESQAHHRTTQAHDRKGLDRRKGIQTVAVAPGGAVITEFKLHVPGNYTIVDHALARVERGLAGLLIVEGAPNTDIYNGTMMPGMGH